MGLLRVLLAVSVFMSHTLGVGSTYGFNGFGGSNSVEIFFMVSGFYIALILDRSYSTNVGFLKNRILRLYPIYYIICGLVLIRSIILPNFHETLFHFPQQALAIGTFANSTFLGSDLLHFLQWKNGNLQLGSFNDSELPLTNMLFVPQSWSIGIEISFYLFAPLLCKAKWRVIAILGVALLTARFAAMFLGLNQDPWTYRFFPFEAPMFLLGILLYRFRTLRRDSLKIGLKKIYALTIMSFFGFGFFTENFHVNQFWQMLILIFLTSIVIVYGEENSRDKRLGDISYPIYMSHLLVVTTYLEVVYILSEDFPYLEKLNHPLYSVPLSLVLTFLLSFLLLQLVKPLEKFREKNRK